MFSNSRNTILAGMVICLMSSQVMADSPSTRYGSRGGGSGPHPGMGVGGTFVEKEPSVWEPKFISQIKYTVKRLVGVSSDQKTNNVDAPVVVKLATVNESVFVDNCSVCSYRNQYIPGLNQMWLRDDATIHDMIMVYVQYFQYHAKGYSVRRFTSSLAKGEQQLVADEFEKLNMKLFVYVYP